MPLDHFIGENSGKPVGLQELVRFGREQVFFNVKEPPAMGGAKSLQAQAGTAIELTLAATPVGPAVVFYTSAMDSRLSKPFAGVPLAEALEIAIAMSEVSAVVLQGTSDAALVIEKTTGASGQIPSR